MKTDQGDKQQYDRAGVGAVELGGRVLAHQRFEGVGIERAGTPPAFDRPGKLNILVVVVSVPMSRGRVASIRFSSFDYVTYVGGRGGTVPAPLSCNRRSHAGTASERGAPSVPHRRCAPPRGAYLDGAELTANLTATPACGAAREATAADVQNARDLRYGRRRTLR